MDMTMWENYIILLESLLWMRPVYLMERERWLKTVIGFHDYRKERYWEQKMS